MSHTESLVVWYLRFNGYFTTPNFTTHPDFKKEPGSSDADILAVRFQHSDERQRNFVFERDRRLIRDCPIDMILAEVKSSRCELNEKWINPHYENVEYALRWVGRWNDPAAIAEIASDVYRFGEWSDAQKADTVRFICFGKTPCETLKSTYPKVFQLLFDHLIEYMRDRMTMGCYQIHRERWEPFIRELGQRFEKKQQTSEILEWIIGKKT